MTVFVVGRASVVVTVASVVAGAGVVVITVVAAAVVSTVAVAVVPTVAAAVVPTGGNGSTDKTGFGANKAGTDDAGSNCACTEQTRTCQKKKISIIMMIMN